MATQTTPSGNIPLPLAETNVTLPTIDGKTAVLYSDPEAVAAIIKKKIDLDLDGLKPNPPNIFQKALRLAVYPVAVVSGLAFAYREARDGIEKYLSEKGRLDNIPDAGASKKDSFNRERVKAHKEEIRNNIKGIKGVNGEADIPGKEHVIRDFLGLPSEKPKGFVNRLKDFAKEGSRTIEIASEDPAREARIVFNGLFATTAAMGLLLTLSDNKNFLSFGKKSNLDKDVALDR